MDNSPYKLMYEFQLKKSNRFLRLWLNELIFIDLFHLKNKICSCLHTCPMTDIIDYVNKFSRVWKTTDLIWF